MKELKALAIILMCSLGIFLMSCDDGGDEIEKEITSVTDVDGNTYKVVKIGDQYWMAENLRTTMYNDGTDIPNLIANEDWKSSDEGAFCWLDNNEENKEKGALYNGYAITTEKLAPEGWRIPTQEDFVKLEMYLGMSSDDANIIDAWRGLDEGKKIKSKNGWLNDENGTDIFGFAGLPLGTRRNDDGSFVNKSTNAYFWSQTENNDKTELIRRSLQGTEDRIHSGFSDKGWGMTIRCIKNEKM